MPKSDKETFDALVMTAKSFAPNFKVIPKNKHWLHKLIGAFSKLYMEQYWTTVGSTVAYPTGGDPYGSWEVIPHEGRHAIQAKRVSEFLFVFLYLMGHFTWFIIGALLTLIVSVPLWVKVSWWAGLIPLVTFLVASPVPFAFFRYRWEYEAYTMSIAVVYWRTGEMPSDDYLKHMSLQFTTWLYWFMWPFGSKSMMKRLRKARDTAMSPNYTKDKYNAAVLKAIKDCGHYRAPGS